MSGNKQNTPNIKIQSSEKNHSSVMKVLNDFLVDIMGAIIPGFLFVFSLGITLSFPIILYFDISIPKSFYNSLFSFGSITLILLLSYVIGHAFYRASINDPDDASIEKKIKKHIKEVYNESKVSNNKEVINAEGISKDIPEGILYRIKQMHLDTKYVDSSCNKSLANYVSLFYNELISGVPIQKETDVVFYIIKNHFDYNDDYHKTVGDNNGLNSIANRSDFFNLIDILSDCIDYVIDICLDRLKIIEKEEDSSKYLSSYMRVFFKEVKYIDYCDNYCEYKYLLNLISRFKDLSFSSKSIGEFNKALEKYKTHILVGSGVKEAYINDYKSILNRQSKTIRKKYNSTDYIYKLQYNLLLFASIRRVQNEEGTPHKGSGGFPYINYENYLFKRNLHHLAEMVNWNYREGRTKNQINRYKIKIQLFCPDAYGVLNKNESHVRMASSSWFTAKFLVITNIVLITILFVLHLFPNSALHLNEGNVPLFQLLISPISVAVLLYLLKRKIEDFIHYQRLREIYFALYTYHECKNEIKYKEEYFSHCLFPDNEKVTNIYNV